VKGLSLELDCEGAAAGMDAAGLENVTTDKLVRVRVDVKEAEDEETEGEEEEDEVELAGVPLILTEGNVNEHSDEKVSCTCCAWETVAEVGDRLTKQARQLERA
jgi:hypothetical protein